MADYTNEYSNYPSTLMEKTSFLDVDDSVADLINQIKAFQTSGEYNSAASLISQHPDIKKRIPTSESLNKMLEEIRNTQIYAKNIKQTIYADETEPNTMIDGDVWIGGE